MKEFITAVIEKINMVLKSLKQEPLCLTLVANRDSGDYDGCLQNHCVKLNFVIKKNQTIATLQHFIQNRNLQNTLLLMDYVTPQQGELLRNNNMQYADEAGNIFIRYPGVAILVTNCAKPPKIERQKITGRIFTTAGLKLLFLLLTERDALNWSYRQLAKYSGVSLGAVRYIMADLREKRIVFEVDSKFEWYDFEGMLVKWCDYYRDKLLPGIEKRFYSGEIPENLADYPLLASGESAVEKLNLLKSRRVLAYRIGNINFCIGQNRWHEDIDGNIEIRTPFWPECRTLEKIPYLLVYADLLAEDDSRCTEIAGEIFARYLRGK